MANKVTGLVNRITDLACAHPTATAVVVGAAAAPLIPIVVLPILGFGTGGVGAGTAAAWWMSTYGGLIKAGSTISLLQSAGVVGTAVGTKIVLAGTGGALGAVLAKL